jgi:hypothetical protein
MSTPQCYNVVRFVPAPAAPTTVTGGGTAPPTTATQVTPAAVGSPGGAALSGGGSVNDGTQVISLTFPTTSTSTTAYGIAPTLPITTAPTPATAASGIAVTFESPYKLTAGIRPDINRAVCSYAEYAKLADPGAPGSLQFYFTNLTTPDVTMQNVRIVDVEPLHFGLTPADIGKPPAGAGQVPGRFTEYRLYFSDQRDGFKLPRGGRLRIGLLNPSEKDNRPLGTLQPTFMTMTQLVQACLTAMGLTTVAVPADLDNTAAPNDLKWLGSHAPTELQKLLQRANYCLALSTAGTFKLWSIGQGPGPEIPPARRLPQVTLKGMDRRGKTVVFTSYPNQIISTYQLPATGGATPTDPQGNPVDPSVFRYVYTQYNASGGAGPWTAIDSCGWYNGSAGTAVQNHFNGTNAANDENAATMAFRYIQLDPTRFDPDMSPILRKTFDVPVAIPSSNGSLPQLIVPQFQANIVLNDPTDGTWFLTNEHPVVPVTHKLDQNVLLMGCHRLGKMDTEYNGVHDPDPYFQKLNFSSGSDVTFVNFSVPKCLFNASTGHMDPQYFHAGFQRTGPTVSTIVQLDPESTLDAMSDRDTIIVPLPELQLVEVNGAALNTADLNGRAMKYASRYLIDATSPPVVLGSTGFFSFDPNGFISQVEWDQNEAVTHITSLGWFRPTGSYLAKDYKTEEAPHESHPHEAKTQGKLSSLGAPGGMQPNVPTGYYQAPTSGAFSILLVTGTASGGGIYSATVLSSPTPVNPSSNLSQANLGNSSNGSVYAVFPSEMGLGTHQLSASGFLPLVWAAIPLPPATDGTPCYMLVGEGQTEACT